MKYALALTLIIAGSALADDHLVELGEEAVDIVEADNPVTQLGSLSIAPRGTTVTTAPGVIVRATVDEGVDEINWRFTDEQRNPVEPADVPDDKTAVIDRVGRTWVDCWVIDYDNRVSEAAELVIDNPGETPEPPVEARATTKGTTLTSSQGSPPAAEPAPQCIQGQCSQQPRRLFRFRLFRRR